MKDSAERIKEILKENNLTHRQFAEKIGVHASAVSHWANGRYKPSKETMNKIEEMFGNTERRDEDDMKNVSLKRNASGYIDPTAFEAMKSCMSGNMTVKRGDIFYIKAGKSKATGSEINADRPAVIVSNNIGNIHSPVVEVVYLTSQPKKSMTTHVNVLCKVPSIALCEQIHTVSKDRLGEWIRICTDAELNAIDRALKVSLGLNMQENDVNQKKLDRLQVMNGPLKAELIQVKAERDGLKIQQCEDHLIDEKIFSYEAQIEHLKSQVSKLTEENEFYKNQGLLQGEYNPLEITILQTQRDIYQAQYEMLLERLIER